MKAFLYRVCAIFFSHFVLYPDYRISFFIPLAFRFADYRPERKFYIDQIMERDPRYRFLYQIRPGVTSYATLYNGYTDTMEKMLRRLRYDLFYLEHRSWFFDFKILVKTFLNIAFGKKF